MKKAWAFLSLLWILFLPFSSLAEETASLPLPQLLCFTQHTVEMPLGDRSTDRRTYPDTENAAVNEAVSAMVDALAEKNAPSVPDEMTVTGKTILDTGATVTVTGTKVASFFVLSHVLYGRSQTAVDFDTAVFDLKTGARLKLNDLLNADAFHVLRAAVLKQAEAYFPAETADAKRLNALADSVSDAPFTLTPAYLVLHFRADALYAGKQTLMHVRLPYTELNDYMTAYALEQTDNSMYRTAALTFDDGPAQGVTRKILLALRENGAVGTFFNLGKQMRKSPEVVCWEHDAGHSVQSHTYEHELHPETQKKMLKMRDRFAKEQEELIGIAPVYMRAPGGNDKLYAKWKVGLPIIRWNCLTGDASETVDVNQSMSTFTHTLKDHAVVLMHCIRYSSLDVLEAAAARLRLKGYLYVTVDEFFLLKGITPQDNVVYWGDE